MSKPRPTPEPHQTDGRNHDRETRGIDLDFDDALIESNVFGPLDDEPDTERTPMVFS